MGRRRSRRNFRGWCSGFFRCREDVRSGWLVSYRNLNQTNFETEADARFGWLVSSACSGLRAVRKSKDSEFWYNQPDEPGRNSPVEQAKCYWSKEHNTGHKVQPSLNTG